jgi:hypothetical protein
MGHRVSITWQPISVAGRIVRWKMGEHDITRNTQLARSFVSGDRRHARAARLRDSTDVESSGLPILYRGSIVEVRSRSCARGARHPHGRGEANGSAIAWLGVTLRASSSGARSAPSRWSWANFPPGPPCAGHPDLASWPCSAFGRPRLILHAGTWHDFRSPCRRGAVTVSPISSSEIVAPWHQWLVKSRLGDAQDRRRQARRTPARPFVTLTTPIMTFPRRTGIWRTSSFTGA